MIRARITLRRALIGVLASLAITVVAAPSASANFEFAEAGVSVKSDGTYTRQAGGHPDFSFNFSVPLNEVDPDLTPLEAPRDVLLDLPPGFFANPTSFPTCTIDQLAGATNGLNTQLCPIASQVGRVDIKYLLGGGNLGEAGVGLFNLQHGPDVPAKFGFNYVGYMATIVPQVRPEDHGFTAGSFEIGRGIVIRGAKVTLWADPANPSHDTERQGIVGDEEGLAFITGIPFPSTAPRVPFFSSPTSCPETGSSFTARGDSWETPGIFDTVGLATDEEGIPFQWEGCEQLPFAPKAEVDLEGASTHTPTGLGVQLELPQNEGLNGLSTSAAKQVTLTLPDGMAISPSVAAGQSGCTLAQVDLDSNDAPTCPASARLGTIELRTQLLDETLQGYFVLAAQNDNPFNSTYAVYMLIDGPGFWLKLPGQLLVDKQTG